MNRFRNILYVCEFSVDQTPALGRAVSLARNNQATLTVIDVIPRLTPGMAVAPGGPSEDELQGALTANHRAKLEALLATYRQQLDIQFDVRVGRTFLEVIQAVLRQAYDLVIKPAENPDWVQRLFGSDDMHLLRKCPCPVWIMKPTEKPNYTCILAAVDFDPALPDTLGQGPNPQIVGLASALALSDFAALHLAHVWDAPADMLLRTWSDNPLEDSKHYVEAERERHRRGLNRLNEDLRDKMGAESHDFLSPHLHVMQGAPRRLIPELAQKLPADLVVMGTVARTGIAGLFIGNTAEAILDQLNCSVLAIKPPGFVSPVKLDD